VSNGVDLDNAGDNKSTGRRHAYVGPQIGMNPISVWGLPDLEY
jgi:hypothetical protein